MRWDSRAVKSVRSSAAAQAIGSWGSRAAGAIRNRHFSPREKITALCAACFLVGAGLGAGVYAATSSNGPAISVTYQAAPATVTPGNNALIVLQQQMLNTLISQGVATANLPARVDNIQTSITTSGIQLSGNARGSILGVGYTVPWRATGIVTAANNGTLAVALTNVHAFGGTLPGVFTQALAGVIDRQLNREVASIPNFQVQRVELSKQELLIFLDYVPS